MMKPLTDLELLRGAPLGHLRAIAEARRLPPAAAPAVSAGSLVLEEMARRLFHEPALREALRGLSPPQWAILRELARCGGQASSYDLRAYVIVAGLIPDSGRVPDAQIRLYELVLGQLLGLGLVFWGRLDAVAAREYASGAHEGLLVVPPSVLALLAAPDAPVEEAPAAHWQPRAPRLALPEALQRDLYCYWSHVREQADGLALLTNGLLPKSALRPLNAALTLKGEIDDIKSEQDALRLFFLRLLGQALGLLEVRSNTVRAIDASAFFALSLAERVQRCFAAWRDGTFWNEFLHLPGVTLRPPPPLEAARPEVLRARQAALALLREEAPDCWISRAVFLALARLRRPHLLFVPRGKGPAVYAAAAGNLAGREFRSRAGWLLFRDGQAQVEGAFLAAMLEGPLHWLGAVDLDYASSGEPAAYRLSPVGLALLGQADWPPELTETEPGRLVIQPNFEMLALPPVRESMLLFLDQVAERWSFDQVAQYRLTRERWLAALQQGNSAALIERLEYMAQAALPQNLRYSLLEWERQAQRVRLHRHVALLEVQEAALLDSFLADSTLAPLIIRRLAPTAALVDRRQLFRLYAALLERGHLPRSVYPA